MNKYTLLAVHSVIRFFMVRGEKAADIMQILKETYGGGCCDESMARRWTKQFCEGRTHLEDETYSKRPSDSITDVNTCESVRC